jgi:hypothetical protein
MKTWMPISMMFLALSAVSYGQATPTASVSNTTTAGWGLPSLDGNFHYALSASQLLQIGQYGSGNVTHATALSGSASYANVSEKLPFSMILSGGVLLGNSNQGTTAFQNISVSQGLIRGKWVLNVTDSFSYLPQSPTIGLSGIPGVGDLGTQPIEAPGESPTGGILTYSGNRYTNTLGGNIERRITGRTSITGSAGWSVLRFFDNNGLDTTQISGTVGASHRLDARDTISVSAVYSTYNTDGNTTEAALLNPLYAVNFETRGLNAGYMRLLTKSLTLNASAGPQWVNSSSGILIPSHVNLAANVDLSYNRKVLGANLAYSRGVNGGSGVLPGALADTISASVGRSLTRAWMASAQTTYSRTSGLLAAPTAGETAETTVNGVTHTFYAGGQLSRAFGRSWSGWVSYGAQNQSTNSSLISHNAFVGFSQTFAVGVTFAPRATRLGQF